MFFWRSNEGLVMTKSFFEKKTAVFCLALLISLLSPGPVSVSAENLIQPRDIQYAGAFRLPGDEGRDQSFSYGGYAMTFSPKKSGSLYIMGHPRLAYGEFDDGNKVAQVYIPVPVRSKRINDLKTATFIQRFINIRKNFFAPYAEIPQVGMAYLDTPQTGEKIHVCWGQHFHETPEEKVPTHAWFNPDLSRADIQGAWYIGNQSLYSTNAYLFEIDKNWADRYLNGKYLATGRYRDGGWSGQGPALFAYAPWQSGSPPQNGTRLKETVLLQYESSRTSVTFKKSMKHYQHADDWVGGAWLTRDNRTALIFAGTKGTGDKYWYGWRHPQGEHLPCVETAFVDQFTTCRTADGRPCPPEDLTGCSNHDDSRGWWSSKFNAALIFYNPDDLARVANGEMKPFEPQPYASLYIDEHLFLVPGIEPGMLGEGGQRLSRIGSIAYDRKGSRLFVLEPFADGTKPVIHVFNIR